MDNKELLQAILERVTSIDTQINNLKEQVTNIELHLENVTDKNIQTVAEGHLDLSRKLNEALKVEEEKELLVIRVRILEDELRRIKKQLKLS